MSQKPKVSTKQALKALRRRGTKIHDVVVAVRCRVDADGQWAIEWEAANWLDLEEDQMGGSGLPHGVAAAIGREFISVAANDSAEQGLGRFGTALGKGIVQSVSSHFEQMLNKEQ